MNGKQLSIDVWEVWKEYEKIAMHFNDLIIKLRIQALGGVAALSVGIGAIAKFEHEAPFSWLILFVSFLFLSLLWLAIWRLDFGYYNKLLQGAVEEVLRLEELSGRSQDLDKIHLSHSIMDAEMNDEYLLLKRRVGCGRFFSARWMFYILVLVGLLGITIFSAVKVFH